MVEVVHFYPGQHGGPAGIINSIAFSCSRQGHKRAAVLAEGEAKIDMPR